MSKWLCKNGALGRASAIVGTALAVGPRMLAEWLAPMPVDELACACLHRSAWALPHSARSALDVLDWRTLGEVLGAGVVPGGPRLASPARCQRV